MLHGNWFIFWLVGLIALGLWAGVGLFSPSAKMRRRRRKSHSRIISKVDRPSVRFSVKPPKE